MGIFYVQAARPVCLFATRYECIIVSVFGTEVVTRCGEIFRRARAKVLR